MRVSIGTMLRWFVPSAACAACVSNIASSPSMSGLCRSPSASSVTAPSSSKVRSCSADSITSEGRVRHGMRRTVRRATTPSRHPHQCLSAALLLQLA